MQPSIWKLFGAVVSHMATDSYVERVLGMESATSGMAYRNAEQRSFSFSVGWGRGRLRQSRRGLLRIRLWMHGR